MTTPPNREALRAMHKSADFAPDEQRPVDAPFSPNDVDGYDSGSCWYYVRGYEGGDKSATELIGVRREEVADFVAAAFTAIPALLDELERVEAERDEARRTAEWRGGSIDEMAAEQERLIAEIERLTINHDHSCTCPHGDAKEPLNNHDKVCPIRVNKFRRIAPEVALSRLAAALDSGGEVDDLTAQRDAALAEVERLRGEAGRLSVASERVDSELELVKANLPLGDARLKMWLSDVQDLLGHYRPTSHAPREGGGDE